MFFLETFEKFSAIIFGIDIGYPLSNDYVDAFGVVYDLTVTGLFRDSSPRDWVISVSHSINVYWRTVSTWGAF